MLTGIEGQDVGRPQVRIQPNPTRGLLQLLTDPALLGERWEVTDLKGRIVRSGAFRTANQRVRLQGLSEGVYLFRSVDGVQRLVIQH